MISHPASQVTTTSPKPRPKSQFGGGRPSILVSLKSNDARGARLPLTNTRSTTLAKAQSGRGSLPEKIGKYVIINEVGRGSTGVVYLSHDPYYGRDVAIKVYNVDASGDENRKKIARKMFLSEAHMVGMLQHPNILPIYDAGEENGHCYIVTEHVHGARTLAA